MTGFTGPLISADEYGLPLTLYQPLEYRSAIWPEPIVVPVGFQTDLASIPRFLWSILPPIGRYDRPAVIHDFLYFVGITTREMADDILREAMESVKVGRFTKWTVYEGVKVGGGRPWNRYRARDKVRISPAVVINTADPLRKSDRLLATMRDV